MNIAFYAPMKSPNHPSPSGDRYIARLLLEALDQNGFNTHLASEFRSWEGKGQAHVQEAIAQEGKNIATDLIDHYQALPVRDRPQAWFTYHLYHKAPDWIGPSVSRALGIPYFLAEASVSAKQARGQWSEGYRASVLAIQQARKIFNLNPRDIPGLRQVVHELNTLVNLPPFLPPTLAPPESRIALRERIGLWKNISPHDYWLCCVAMMRKDSKHDSYQLLAKSMQHIERQDWQLLIIGSGVAEAEIKQAFSQLKNCHFLGQQDALFIHEYLCASDLFVWPAINEAFGMAMLEALRAGLPVIAGRSKGVAQVVDHMKTGILVDPITPNQFAITIDDLLANPAQIANMAKQSVKKFSQHHTLQQASIQLRQHITEIISAQTSASEAQMPASHPTT